MPLRGRHRLRDGTEVLIRPLDPGDKARLEAGLGRMSERSRYYRFAGSHGPKLSTKELAYLTEVDQVNHLAWGAIDPDSPEQPGLGVARCIRLEDEPTVAEVALAVADDHQGRGLGTLLLGVLGAAAREQGIHAFRGYVLATNHTMLEILEELGAKRGGGGGSALWFDIPLPGDPSDFPNTPAGRVFRAISDQA